MANPSTIWAQLAMPNPPAGSIPYVLSDGATIGTDVLNLSYDSTAKSLFVANGLEVNSQSNQAGIASPVTINHVMGVATIKAGTSSTTINNSLVGVGDQAFVQRRNNDVTAVQLTAITGVGQIVVTANANATADLNFTFIIIHATVVTG